MTVTSVARMAGGAHSAMYTGTVTDARPTPNPTSRRPDGETQAGRVVHCVKAARVLSVKRNLLKLSLFCEFGAPQHVACICSIIPGS